MNLPRIGSWVDILPMLGVECFSPRLPAILPCPSCGEQSWHIYRTAKEEWTRCTSCGISCDIIQMLATTSNRALPTVVGELASKIQHPAIRDAAVGSYFLRTTVRDNMRKLWDQAKTRLSSRSNLSSSQSAYRVLLQMQFSSDKIRLEPWRLYGDVVLGSCSATMFEDIMMKGHTWVETCGGTRSSPFAPREAWDDMLVLPTYEVPGLICGFTLIDTSGNTKEPYIHYHPQFVKMRGYSGIGLLPALDNMQRFSTHHPVLVDDPLVALRWQSIRCCSGGPPLPILYAQYNKYTGAMPTSAPDIPGIDSPVVWSTTSASVAIKIASMFADGRVVLPDKPLPLYDLSYHDIKSQLCEFSDTAEHWQTALLRLIAEDELPATETIEQLPISINQKAALRAAIADTKLKYSARTAIYVGGKEYAVDGTGIYNESGTQVSDAVVTINRVYCNRDGKDTWYEYTVRHGDQVGDDVAKATTRWFTAETLRRAIPNAAAIHVEPKFAKIGPEVAKILGNPEILPLDGFGVQADGRIQYPRCGIRLGGEVIHRELLSTHSPCGDNHPCEASLPPMAYEDDIDATQFKRYGALLACVVDNIVNLVKQQQPQPITVVSRRDVQHYLYDMGIPTLVNANLSSSSVISRINKYHEQHCWLLGLAPRRPSEIVSFNPASLPYAERSVVISRRDVPLRERICGYTVTLTDTRGSVPCAAVPYILQKLATVNYDIPTVADCHIGNIVRAIMDILEIEDIEVYNNVMSQIDEI